MIGLNRLRCVSAQPCAPHPTLDAFPLLSLRLTALLFVFMLNTACHKGDPTIACRVDTDGTKCSVVPEREHSDQVIQIAIQHDGTCTIDKAVVTCSEVGKRIRAGHVLDNPTVTVCGDRNVAYDVVGGVLKALVTEDLPAMFGCTQDK